MKNVKKLLFATLLVAAALASAPAKVQADVWCNSCDASGGTDCFACCKCDGGTTSACIRACGG